MKNAGEIHGVMVMGNMRDWLPRGIAPPKNKQEKAVIVKIAAE